MDEKKKVGGGRGRKTSERSFRVTIKKRGENIIGIGALVGGSSITAPGTAVKSAKGGSIA